MAPEAAPHLMALKLAGKGSGLVRQWQDEQAGNAVAGLVPLAAERGKLGDAVIEYLREARRKGHGALIEEQLRLEKAPPEAAARVRRLVLDPSEKVYTPLSDSAPPDWLRTALDATVIPAKNASLPSWAAPRRLPPVTVGEHCLSDAMVDRLLHALKLSPRGLPAPLVAAVKEHADRASLEAFAWRLFELWDEEHGPRRDRWALNALAHLGGDATALKLTPLIRAWRAGGSGVGRRMPWSAWRSSAPTPPWSG
jgi:hypothetical protein